MEQAVNIVLLVGLSIICLLGLAYLYISVAEAVLMNKTKRCLANTRANYLRKSKPAVEKTDWSDAKSDWDDFQVRMR